MPLIVLAITLALTSAACSTIQETRRRIGLATSEDEAMSAAPPGISRTAWRWRGTVGSKGSTPENPASYRVVLLPDGRVQVQADCNTVEGRYVMVRSRLGIEMPDGSRAVCNPGSLGDAFLRDLGSASAWSMRGGDLYVRVAAGRMRFSQ